MEYFTMLTIVYVMGGQPLEAKILFASEDDCWNVLLDTDTIYDQINGQARLSKQKIQGKMDGKLTKRTKLKRST